MIVRNKWNACALFITILISFDIRFGQILWPNIVSSMRMRIGMMMMVNISVPRQQWHGFNQPGLNKSLIIQ